MPDAHVLGAGIGGLAAAVALAASGWSVSVWERATERRVSGGGIGLMPNGMRALDALGVGDRIRACSVVQTEGGVRSPTGRWLARQDLDLMARRHGEPIRAMRRTDLVAALEDALPAGTLRYGQRGQVVDGGSAQRPARLRFLEASEVSADLVVAADGIRSATRNATAPDHPGLRDCGLRSWRAVVPSAGLAVTAGETWGRGLRFSVLPLPDGEVHFSALAHESRLRPVGSTGRAPAWRELFGSWHDPVPALLARAEEGDVFAAPIEELARPLGGYGWGRTALLGDAAHPMTPNVGSANLALEDAVELARAVGLRADGVVPGLATYDASRRPRAAGLARASRWMGRVAEVRSRPLALLRDVAVVAGGRAPKAWSARSLDGIAGWAPSVP